MNYGEWENKTYDILKHKLRYQQWIQAPFSLGSKEGEDFPSFALRIRQALESILVDSFEKHLSRVAVVTHGGVIRLLLHQLVASECTFFDWKIPYSRSEERRVGKECKSRRGTEKYKTRQQGVA